MRITVQSGRSLVDILDPVLTKSLGNTIKPRALDFFDF